MGRNVVIPKWSKNLGYMLAFSLHNGDGPGPSEFHLSCTTCGYRIKLTPLKVAELILAKGPLWSPWNRRPRCRTPACNGTRFFSGRSGGDGSMVIPFLTEPDNVTVVSLHAAWKAESRRERVSG